MSETKRKICLVKSDTHIDLNSNKPEVKSIEKNIKMDDYELYQWLKDTERKMDRLKNEVNDG